MSAPETPSTERPEAAEDHYAVPPELVRAVAEALEAEHPASAKELVAPLHAADLADLIEILPRDRRHQLVEALGRQLDPDVLTELDSAVLEDVLQQLTPEHMAWAIGELDTDDAVYLLEHLDELRREAVLRHVPAPDRTAVTEGLAFPEESAGRLMQREMIAVPAYWTVGQVIDYCRETEDLPEDFYEIFVVDPRHRPIGYVPLNRALRAKRPVLVRDIMEAQNRPIPVGLDQEEVALLFQRYRLSSAPVVDDAGRLVGVITFDDVADVIAEEAEEDLLALGGLAGETDLYDPVLRTVRRRATWLLLNLGTAIAAAFVVSLFGATIEKAVALAALMPIVASMGGNAGTQTLTVAVRAIATRELTPANAFRIVWKQVAVGGINGLLFAVLIGLIAGFWFGSPVLGGVIGVAMIINLLVAGFFGALIPMTLHRLGIDPAVAAPVFLTTLTDVIGFLAFLGLATLALL